MLTDRTLWQAAQVADRLGISPAAFAQRRRRLEDDHGFPPPVPGLCRRWNPAAIEAWLARQAGGIPDSLLVDPENILIARARAMAAA
jgi:predicted DNA-binding transcriptional regulator AlpA